MQFIGDFHIHSHFSVATSRNLIPEYMSYWAYLKGITVLGTGDFTHPGWLAELKEKLIPAEEGLYKLKPEYSLKLSPSPPRMQTPTPFSFPPSPSDVRFITTGEISNIYKKNGKVKKVHNLIFTPSLEDAEKVQLKLAKIGNISSDGRPILGLDSRDLLEIILDASENSLLVPAHIWTPWFSVLGSNSGFDSVEECYTDLSKYITAVETGLSSDPPMNRICSRLDPYILISNSDAHSPENIGREANLLNTEISYSGIIHALSKTNTGRFLGTIEFFPQEGKYHFDGHRKCGVCFDPVSTIKNGGYCPVCGKKLTIGVMNRVAQLADRENFENSIIDNTPFHSLIPLKQLLSEIHGAGIKTKKITYLYNSLIKNAGSELNLLLFTPLKKISEIGGDTLREGIRRMREREIYIKEGYDGEYGEIKVFSEEEVRSLVLKESLFEEQNTGGIRSSPPRRGLLDFSLKEYRKLNQSERRDEHRLNRTSLKIDDALSEEQQCAASHFRGPALVLAGPGTGKTKTLIQRIINLVTIKEINPDNILAITFTNRTATELKKRFSAIIGYGENYNTVPHISTFHALGLSILKEHCRKLSRNVDLVLFDEDDRKYILKNDLRIEEKKVKLLSSRISLFKQRLSLPEEVEDKEFAHHYRDYEKILEEYNAFDLDDLIFAPVKLFTQFPKILEQYHSRFHWVMVDEYQDINYAQYRFMRMLIPDEDSNIYVIGDPHQAIYGFRGSDVRYINQFIDDYPKAQIYRLGKSYRCTDTILLASRQVMGDQDRKKFPEITGTERGIKIKIIETNSEKGEAEVIARTIEQMLGGLRFFSMDSRITDGGEDHEIESLSEIAVLCRIGRQMEALEKAFLDHSIPYQKVGEVPFFKQEPVRSIIELFKLSGNPGASYLKKKIETNPLFSSDFTEKLSHLEGNKTARQKIEMIVQNCLNREVLEDSIPEWESLISQLFTISNSFDDKIDEFIKFITLGSDADAFTPHTEEITLITIHAAKGLEWDCVFIPGCEDGLIPYSLFPQQSADPDEERRLFYVGMTRARKYLYLTYARKRFLFGREYTLRRTPFLATIEEELKEQSKEEGGKKKTEDHGQLKLF